MSDMVGSLRHRRKGNDEGELRTEDLDQLVVCRDEFTAHLLGQGDVEAVVDTAAHCGRDIDRTG